jgi:lipoprotein LprG
MNAPGRSVCRSRAGVVGSLVALLVPLAACSGGGGGGSVETPEQVLGQAKDALDQTSGVTLSLTTGALPDKVDGILEATGIATHAPAFTGDLTVVVDGLDVEVPVVSVDGRVYAKLPFTVDFAEVNPEDYGAPDPAQLMDPDTGLSAWLTEATGIEEAGRSRDGRLVLSSYRGSLSGDVVDASIPSADANADFPVTFRIDEDGRLRSVKVSGPFYGSKGTVDYTVGVDDYGTQKNITRP